MRLFAPGLLVGLACFLGFSEDERIEIGWYLVVAAIWTVVLGLVLRWRSRHHPHTKRAMAALFTRIPASIRLALLTISTFCMLNMEVQIGFTGKRRLIAVIPMLLAFAVLVTLVVDLDRPQSGLIRVSLQAMTDLQKSMSGKAG